MPQSLAKVYVHIVFSTKNRKPFVHVDIRSELYAYMATVLAEHGSPAVIIDGTADHVHILCRMSRTVTIARLVEEAKKRTSIWIKTKGPQYDDFAWQTGYSVFSVGESGVVGLSYYIGDQRARHMTESFQDELRQLLESHRLECDERYVWD